MGGRGDFEKGLIAGDDGRKIASHLQGAQVRRGGGVGADDPGDKTCKRFHERQKQRGRDEVEERVNRGHRRGDVRVGRDAVRRDRIRVMREEG